MTGTHVRDDLHSELAYFHPKDGEEYPTNVVVRKRVYSLIEDAPLVDFPLALKARAILGRRQDGAGGDDAGENLRNLRDDAARLLREVMIPTPLAFGGVPVSGGTRELASDLGLRIDLAFRILKDLG